LSKVRKEGKLKLVEPSEEIKDSYLKKSESYFILLNFCSIITD